MFSKIVMGFKIQIRIKTLWFPSFISGEWHCFKFLESVLVGMRILWEVLWFYKVTAVAWRYFSHLSFFIITYMQCDTDELKTHKSLSKSKQLDKAPCISIRVPFCPRSPWWPLVSLVSARLYFSKYFFMKQICRHLPQSFTCPSLKPLLTYRPSLQPIFDTYILPNSI